LESEGLNVRNHLGDPGASGRLTIKVILKEQDVRMWTVFIWPKIGICGGLIFECDKMSSGYITLEELLY
jgi:hypothetical protein